MKLSFVDEFSKKWKDTTIVIRENCLSAPIYCTIKSIVDDNMINQHTSIEKKLHFNVYINGEEKLTKINLSNYIIDLNIPHTGYFNSGITCSYRYRTTKKQWKRGMCNYNTKIETLLPSHIDYIPDPNAVEEGPVNIHVAIDSIVSGEKYAVAFTNHFAIGQHEYVNKVILYYKNTAIGFLGKKEEEGTYQFLINNSSKYFIEELSQYLPVTLI